MNFVLALGLVGRFSLGRGGFEGGESVALVLSGALGLVGQCPWDQGGFEGGKFVVLVLPEDRQCW